MSKLSLLQIAERDERLGYSRGYKNRMMKGVLTPFLQSIVIAETGKIHDISKLAESLDITRDCLVRRVKGDMPLESLMYKGSRRKIMTQTRKDFETIAGYVRANGFCTKAIAVEGEIGERRWHSLCAHDELRWAEFGMAFTTIDHRKIVHLLDAKESDWRPAFMAWLEPFLSATAEKKKDKPVADKGFSVDRLVSEDRAMFPWAANVGVSS